MQFVKSHLSNLGNENIDFFKFIQGNNIESFKKDNINEKNQINALLVKIIECQENINNLLKNLDEINDTSSLMKRKIDDNDK